MKENIRGRKKRFWTLILAVIIGLFPTIEVWAATYTMIVDCNSSKGAADGYSAYLKVTLDGEPKGEDQKFTIEPSGGDNISLSFTGDDTPDYQFKIVYFTPNAGQKLTETDVITITKDISYDLILPQLQVGASTFPDITDTQNKWETYWSISAFSGKIATLYFKSDASATGYPTTPNEQNLTLDLNGGTLNPALKFTKYIEGVEIVLPIPTKGGSTFVGWKDDATGQIRTSIGKTDTGALSLTAQWTDARGGGGASTPKPDPHKITYIPNNNLNETFVSETEEAKIELPKVLFTAQPGQMLEGWKVADTTQDPAVAIGDLFKPGTKYDIDADIAFMAIWKDNPTFKIECDDNFDLMPPENTPENLEQMIRESLKITYYEDGEEPEEGDTEKVRKIYRRGTAIPAEDLEIVITDPKLYRKMGPFDAKIIYKGLYKRTLEKTVSVTVLDPNDPTFASFDITDIEELGNVTVTYPDSIACHGSKWKQAKSYVSIACDAMSITTKKVKTSDFEEVKAGQKGEIIKIKGKISKSDDLNKEEARKLSKKLNKKIKKQLPKTIAIRPLIVMPDMFAGASVRDGELKSVSIMLEDKTKIIIKPDDFTVDEEKQVVTFSGNYGGNLTFEELELASAPAK